MPVDGLASPASVQNLPDLVGGQEVLLEGAEILHLFFEVPGDAVRAAIPPALHPTIPGAAYITFLRFPTTPWGPVTLAELRLAARLREKPRALLVAAVIDADPSARSALAAGWGLVTIPGRVRLDRWYDRVDGSASLDGTNVLQGSLGDPEPIYGATLQYGPLANAVRTDAGSGIALVDPVFSFGEDRQRGTLDVPLLDGTRLGAADVRATVPIGVYFGSGDLLLPPPASVLDAGVPRGLAAHPA